MRRKKLLVLLGSVCLILVLAALPFMMACAPAAPGAPEEITLKVGTGPVGGNWFPLGAVVSTIRQGSTNSWWRYLQPESPERGDSGLLAHLGYDQCQCLGR